MSISLKQEILSTSIHYKTTDSHSYLDYRSSHNPSNYCSSHNPSTKNKYPISQFLGLRRLCLDDADFTEKADEMTDFINRHYPKSIIKKAFDLVKLIPRQQILQPNCVTAAEDRLILSLLYHSSTIHVWSIILKNWSFLQVHMDMLI